MKKYTGRRERLTPKKEQKIFVDLIIKEESKGLILKEISSSGLLALLLDNKNIHLKTIIDEITITANEASFTIRKDQIEGIKRIEEIYLDQISSTVYMVAISFQNEIPTLLSIFKEMLTTPPFVRDELTEDHIQSLHPTINALEHSALDFYHVDSPDLFLKCDQFYEMIKDLQHKELYQSMYRVTLTSGLDHRITIFNPIKRTEDEFICFDSNSYLGLHIHPKVIEATTKVLKITGYGTPSAQLLCGTNKYLRDLEDTISEFHGKDDTMIFSAGYNANLGAIFALVRKNDVLIKDRFSHASIHDACRMLDTPRIYTYPHMDHEKLEYYLNEAEKNEEVAGKLVVVDGIFSMHGKICNLPIISSLCKKYNAKLMVDEAHTVGILGQKGRGTEDYYNMPNSIDVLMGTFSKAPGTCGGYISGKKEMIYYLRFYGHAGVFTASLPAPTCAGLKVAFDIMKNEPEHRERLWKNTHSLARNLIETGFILPEPESPILTVFMGTNQLLWVFSKELFNRGIKCGNVAFPAVPHGESILRITMNARHTKEDIEQCTTIMKEIGMKYGILGKNKSEIREIGKKIGRSA